MMGFGVVFPKDAYTIWIISQLEEYLERNKRNVLGLDNTEVEAYIEELTMAMRLEKKELILK